MATKVVREIELKLTAADVGASRVMKAVRANMDRELKAVQTSTSGDLIFGPANRPRFSQREQLVRDEIARAYRAMRAQAKIENARLEAEGILKEARERLFGPDPAPRRALRDISSRTADEQLIRDRQARRLRAAREEAKALREIEQKEAAKGIAGIFGRGSRFKETTELFTGGGAIVGLSLAFNALGRTLGGVGDALRGVKTGMLTTDEAAQKLIHSLPIIGGFAEGLSNFLDAAFTPKLVNIRQELEEVRIQAEKTADFERRFSSVGNRIQSEGRRLGMDEFQIRRDDALQKRLKDIAELNALAEEAKKNNLLPPADLPEQQVKAWDNFDKRIAEVDKDAQDMLKRAVAGAKEFAKQFAQGFRDKAKEVFDQRQQRRDDLDKSIRHARIEGLETEGRLGNRAAAMEAERLRIAERYIERREQLNRILKDELATTQQKRDAEQELAGLTDQERRERNRVGRNAERESQRTAPTLESRFLSGLSQTARDTDRPIEREQLREAKKTNQKLDENSKQLDEMLTALRTGAIRLVAPALTGPPR